MRDAFRFQTADQDVEIDEIVEQLDAADLALGEYLALGSTSAGMSRVRRRRTRPRGPRWYRERIAEWCRDPSVRTVYGVEAVLSTALAVPNLSDEELLLFVHDLTYRASVPSGREPHVPRPRRRAG